MFLVFLLYALFASVFTIAKTGMNFTQPLFFVGSRMLLAGVLMLGYQWIFKKERCQLAKKDLPRLILLALFSIYLTNAFEFWGLKYLTSSKTCFLYSLSPFFSALLSYFLFSESLTSRKWLGLLVGFAGFIPILMYQTAAEDQAGQFFIFSWPELAVMAAAASSVYGWIVLKQLVTINGLTPMMANSWSMCFGGAIALVHSYLVEDWNPFPVTQWVPFVECALLLILISNITCYNLYGHLLKKYSATFLSFAGFVTPFFAALYGWLFLGEEVAYPFYLSAAIVLAGLVLFNQEELRQGVQLDA